MMLWIILSLCVLNFFIVTICMINDWSLQDDIRDLTDEMRRANVARKK